MSQPIFTLFQRVRRPIGKLLTIGVLTYLMVIVMMVIFENRLVYPAWGVKSGDWQPNWMEFENVSFEAADSTRLHGWYLEHPAPRGYLLYCHGNGTNVAELGSRLDDWREEHQLTVFAFDYRGFGKSQGSPHEAGVLSDGEAAHAWFAKRAGIPRDEVILMGRSLGGGVAVHLAAQHGARGLVLERTFTSMPDAAARLYWWAPVRLLMRNVYPSLQSITSYNGPLLQSHGDQDRLVPFDLGQQLFDASPSKSKTFVTMPGVGHNGHNTAEYEAALAKFFAELPSPPEL